MSTNENKLGKAYELLQPAMKDFTSSATANLRDDNYTPEDIANARAVYGIMPIAAVQIADILGMTVEEYNIKAAYWKANAEANEAKAQAEREPKEAKLLAEEKARFEKRNTSVEAMAEYLIDVISTDEVTPDAWVGSGSYGPDGYDEDYGVAVDGFIDTLALVKRLVSLGVIVINEDN